MKRNYAFVAALCLGLVPARAADLIPRNLRCEYLGNPVAVALPNPALSWECRAITEGGRSLSQRAYRIVAASSPDRLRRADPDLWDSGKVPSARTAGIAYAGKRVGPRQPCWWTVRIWDQAGRASDWSEPAVWTGGMEPADWTATWIGKDEPGASAGNPLAAAGANWIWHDEPTPDMNAPVATRLISRRFRISDGATVQRAEAWLAADNRATVKVNDTGCGSLDSFKTARRIDLLPGIRQGENTLRVSVSNLGEAPNPAGLVGLVRITLAGGESVSFVTDGEWQSGESGDASLRPVKVLAPVGNGPWGEVSCYDEGRVLPARHLRKAFRLEEKPCRATASIVGLGYYELYVNGAKVGDHVLDPILTDYEHRVPYVAYDVTGLLEAGEQAVGVLLGNGRYYAPRLNVPTQTKTYGYPKLLFQLDLEYVDGRTRRVVSDTTWKLTDDGPILENNDYDGEVYDARKELAGWASAGYDDRAWPSVQAVTAPRGAPEPAMMPPMRVTETRAPRTLAHPLPGTWVYDLGQNIVGWCRIKVDLPAGWTLRLRHAERLQDDGTLDVANLRGAKCRDLYISNGRPAVYEPRFTYHGFRYAEISLVPPSEGAVTAWRPTLDTLEGRVVHTDLPMVGSFETSNDLLNRLYRNIEWGVRGNYLSIPTDCPQRDERQGWQGDRAAESKGEMFMFDNITLYRKWMQDVADSQRPDGVLSSVCPNYWPMYPGDVTWPSAFTLVPQSLRLQYGDTRCIELHYDAMKRWLASFDPHITDGILERDTYGDWCVPPESPELIHSMDPARKTSKAVLATTYYIHNLQVMAGFADLLGRRDEATGFRQRASDMTGVFNARFLDRDNGRYDNGTQTAAVLPLAFRIVPPADRNRVFASLVNNIEVTTRGHVGTGLIGGQWLNRVLTSGGRPDISLKLATHTGYPSWGYMIENGATTIWELWNGNTADPAMNSGNHVMLVGDLVTWFYESLGGIAADPARPGFEHLVMKPEFVDGLDFVNASFRSVRGPIKSHWRRHDTTVTWEIVIPPNTTATAYIPASAPEQVREGNQSLDKARSLKLSGVAAGRVICELDSGRYRFTVTR